MPEGIYYRVTFQRAFLQGDKTYNSLSELGVRSPFIELSLHPINPLRVLFAQRKISVQNVEPLYDRGVRSSRQCNDKARKKEKAF